MLFLEPDLEALDVQVIREIEEDRRKLRFAIAAPRRWVGLLRRNALARGIRGSNSIEGYEVSNEDAIAILEGGEPLDAEKETRLAVSGYRDAMTFVLQLAKDPQFSYSDGFLRSLHFMMIRHDLVRNPGLWRPGEIFVHDELRNRVVYQGPDAPLIPALIVELLEYLNRPTGSHVLIRAAMAHLNLAMIHPFSDGNGRMARCLQTLVLAREGILEPQFSSIEEYLGRNTLAYYEILEKVGQGTWNPENNARPWTRFCLTAHYRQAKTLVRRAEQYNQAWGMIEELTKRHKLPERVQFALLDATFGMRIRNSSYRVAASVPEYIANRDLKHLVALGLLIADGVNRGRFYRASTSLDAIRQNVALSKEVEDPFSHEQSS